MLENSFLHLSGIGPETEVKLWRQGLRSWQDLSENLSLVFSAKKATQLAIELDLCRKALEDNQWAYFQNRLKGSEMWRLLPELIKRARHHEIAYLDIETTGLGFPPQSESTTIAVLFQGELHVAHEPSIKLKILRQVEAEAKMIVTFNGGPFDLPFLRKEFELSFTNPHLDLRFWFANLGFRGGLKKIQQSFREVPQREFMDIDGFDAVRLWQMHLRGVPRALETLMTYNAEDAIVLEPLTICGLNLEAERKSFLTLQRHDLPLPTKAATRVCPDVYRLLRGGRLTQSEIVET